METIEIKINRPSNMSEARFAFEVLTALRCLKSEWFEPDGDLPVVRDALLQEIADQAASEAGDTGSA